MALEHALLVALTEEPASGLELAKRFDRSLGYFWSATHQQIYRVLGRMEQSGWVARTEIAQQGRPDKKVYAVTDPGRTALADWLAEPSQRQRFRSEFAVKMRGADFGDQRAVLETARNLRADHATRLEHYQFLAQRDYPEPTALTGHELNQYLVLRGGILLEQFWIDWLNEYLAAHERALTATMEST